MTGSTLHKELLFRTPRKLDLLLDLFAAFTEAYEWQPQAWSFFPNHYHFVAISPSGSGETLAQLIRDFHSAASRQLNTMDGTPGRRVLYEYWDTQLTTRGSYFARLRYVHENPVHHGVVLRAENYRWCSAGWFANHATSSMQRLLRNVRTDRVSMYDDFPSMRRSSC